MKKLIIFGIGQIAEVIYSYFNQDSKYEVVCFTADENYIEGKTHLFNLPIIPFNQINQRYSPNEHEMFIAIGFNNLNKDRELKCSEAKSKGYSLASFIHSSVFVWPGFKLKENTFVFENNVIQPFVEIGKNVILWSGNHIGHHSKIEDNVFITSHAVISGAVHIESNSFIGVNATIRDNVNIGKYCVIGAGALVLKNIREYSVLAETTTKRLPISSEEFLKL